MSRLTNRRVTFLAVISLVIAVIALMAYGGQTWASSSSAEEPAASAMGQAEDGVALNDVGTGSDVQGGDGRVSAQTPPTDPTPEPAPAPVYTDADVTKPTGLVRISLYERLTDTTADDVQVERSIDSYPPTGDLPDLTDADFQIVVARSDEHTGRTFTDRDLLPGRRYQYRVTKWFDSVDAAISITRQTGVVQSRDWMWAEGIVEGNGDSPAVKLHLSTPSIAVAQFRITRTTLSTDAVVIFVRPSTETEYIDQYNVEQGEYYRYDLYHGRPRRDDPTSIRYGNVQHSVIVRPGVGTPGAPQSVSATPTASIRVSWEPSVTNSAYVASYLVEKTTVALWETLSDVADPQWERVGTTTGLTIVDHDETPTEHALIYRVTPTSFSGLVGDSGLTRFGRYVTLKCTDAGGEAVKVSGFAITPLLPALEDEPTVGGKVFKERIDGIFFSPVYTPSPNPLKLDEECWNLDVSEYTVGRRWSYAHYNADVCGATTCDVYGGTSELSRGPEEQMATSDMSVSIQPYVLRGIRVQNDIEFGDGPFDNGPGLYQMEYKVCAAEIPHFCSVWYATDHMMFGVSSVPYDVPQDNNQ